MKVRIFQQALVVVAVICFHGLAFSGNPPNYPTGTIELKYYAAGPWQVANVDHACCDSKGHKFDLLYPAQLGKNGFHHPILTWGDGSFGNPQGVAAFLTHMASWGFVIIAPEDPATGPGQTVLDGAKFMINANADPHSIFFQKLDTANVGAFGHSQGAGGAINAMIKSGGIIKTVMPIEFPSRIWCTYGAECADTKNITSGSIFLIDGSHDAISPPTQPTLVPGEQSIAAAYDAVPAGVLKLKGTLKGPNHNDITGQPSCETAKWPCENGLYGYLGYPTAWMMAQLQGDNYAKGAFIANTGEIFSEMHNWEHVASNLH